MENGNQDLFFLFQLDLLKQQHVMKFYTVTLQHIHYCNDVYSVIDGYVSRKIYRLSDDEREWVEIGEIPEQRYYFGVASLNGRIYITGGWKSLILYDKQCIIIYLVMKH